ncbi:MAG: FAD-dependent oxidoreductase [Lentisphaeria bacterium]|nr:FAD-dependent oxidoreductase [Lentisphaeria bacterium]
MSQTVSEPARALDVTHCFDVLVCGGGPAGVAAAIAAARAGAKTGLVERTGCLGGIWTAGLLAYFLDINNKDGLMAEIVQTLEQREARGRHLDGTFNPSFDVEEVKLLLDELVLGAGVKALLDTRVASTLVDDSGRLTHAVVESKSGRHAICARTFIDCTGDGDLAARAGCGFDLGHPETGATQPMSLVGLVGGITRETVRSFYRAGSDLWGEPKERLRLEMERGSHSPSYARPSLFPIRDDLFLLMANHEYGVSGIDADQLSEATFRARGELNRLVCGLRSLGGVWRNLRLLASANHIGVREGRRIHGRYTVTVDDMVQGIRHEDAACTATFGIDVHSTNPSSTKGIEKHAYRVKPYDIPLRALIARDVDGLMMAGRCISGDFLAHSSYRVTGNAVAMGEAAGRHAAGVASSGLEDSAVPVER